MKKSTKLSDSRCYDILIAPLITEKSQLLLDENKVVFKVAENSTKDQVKASIEAIFKVKVTSVNVMVYKKRLKIFRGRKGWRSGFKKAIVTLEKGAHIDLEAFD